MIFVTVGTQLAFDRLVDAVEDWVRRGRDVEVFAQVGPGRVDGRPFPCAPFVKPGDVDRMMKQAEVVVSHAGMGSILTALRYERPIIIMPRKASLGEHRNEHQLATAKWIEGRPGVMVAWESGDLSSLLDRRSELRSGPQLADTADTALVRRLGAYIRGEPSGT